MCPHGGQRSRLPSAGFCRGRAREVSPTVGTKPELGGTHDSRSSGGSARNSNCCRSDGGMTCTSMPGSLAPHLTKFNLASRRVIPLQSERQSKRSPTNASSSQKHTGHTRLMPRSAKVTYPQHGHCSRGLGFFGSYQGMVIAPCSSVASRAIRPGADASTGAASAAYGS